MNRTDQPGGASRRIRTPTALSEFLERKCTGPASPRRPARFLRLVWERRTAPRRCIRFERPSAGSMCGLCLVIARPRLSCARRCYQEWKQGQRRCGFRGCDIRIPARRNYHIALGHVKDLNPVDLDQPSPQPIRRGRRQPNPMSTLPCRDTARRSSAHAHTGRHRSWPLPPWRASNSRAGLRSGSAAALCPACRVAAVREQ
ncbi:hypothetical protein DENSPDRAFT_164078 [Dentipellis sp. KUC8613]|nr:hypothetical protein DENSPDRAFT_164078 [Dentipellis sp. KUC8613]